MTNSANPAYFVIKSSDIAHMGTHEIAIWAVVPSTDPLIRSDTLTTPVIIKFKVLMLNSRCMNGVITAPILKDMIFEIKLPW